jgi:succinoglycan biosynthesis transport protein ExoP
MDTRPINQSSEVTQPRVADALSLSDLAEQINGFIRRQYPIFVFIVSTAFAIGLIYLFTTPPRYTAHALLVIDSSKLRVLQDQHTPLLDAPLDTSQVETQVEVLKSDNIGHAVIKDLDLIHNEEFGGDSGGLFGAFVGLVSKFFSSPEPLSEAAKVRKALGVFKTNRNITRVARTYVLDIAYSSLSPARSASIANAIADAYISDQLEAKYQATRRAGGWLQDRIRELRLQAAQADKAVLDYKEKNKIIDIGTDSSLGRSGSRLLGEQALSELNTQLVTARNATGEAKAKLDRIQDVMNQEVPDAAVTDSLHNEVITRLRNQYLDMSGKEAVWSSRYGADHLATVNLRVQMNELRHSIANELGRIAGSYKSDYEIAKERQISLEKAFAKQVSEAQSINRDRLGLNDLESTAHVYHTIYDNFLQHYMEAIQQESFPITEARVISPAEAPTVSSSPKASIALAIAAALGLVLSVGTAALREAMDRVFRTTKHVEELLGATCLAVLPELPRSAQSNKHPKTRVPSLSKSQNAMASQTLFDARNYFRFVVDEPLSAFAEAFRSIKVAADINGVLKNNKVVGVTSSVPREGKSTVSCNFAELIAHAGKRAILIDADLRNPTLTRHLAKPATVGLLEVLTRKTKLQDAVRTDAGTGLTVLPAVIDTRLAHPNEVFASDVFKQLIDALRASYDYVILDLPPLAPVVDVRATLNVIDVYLYVVEWGKTRIHVAQHQLSTAPEIHDRLLGVVLNKANIAVLDRYQHYYGGSTYKYYRQYGQDG